MQWPQRDHATKPRVAFRVIDLGSSVLGWLGVVLFVALLLYQAKVWLDTGFWPAMPVRILFTDTFPTPLIMQAGSWYNAPTRWFGLHAVAQFLLNNVPLSLFFLIVGRALALLFEMVTLRLIPRISTKATPSVATFK